MVVLQPASASTLSMEGKRAGVHPYHCAPFGIYGPLSGYGLNLEKRMKNNISKSYFLFLHLTCPLLKIFILHQSYCNVICTAFNLIITVSLRTFPTVRFPYDLTTPIMTGIHFFLLGISTLLFALIFCSKFLITLQPHLVSTTRHYKLVGGNNTHSYLKA